MSVRVVRWDTGREHEIPDEALRWGPNTKQETCRAALLRPLGRVPGIERPVPWIEEGDVPYVLPFEGAKWAVRVTLRPTGFLAGWIGGGWRTGRQRLADEAFVDHTFSSARESREKLRSLLEAAGDALRSEGNRPRGRSVPDDTALSLLAECLDECLFPDALSRRVRAFLERETSAEIRRAWKGGGRG